jgi:putative transposase
MRCSEKEISKEKLERLKKEMEHSLKGCRRIADAFNREMGENCENISIGKTKVYEIMVEMDVYVKEEEKKKLDGHIKRPPEPFLEFAMDFTEKVIVGGERAYILDLIDKYSNTKIILDAHEKQDTDAVIHSLEKFSKIFGHRGATITVDNGKEFKNGNVIDYCSRNAIILDFVNKGCPWENAFVERDIRTLHEECLNLVWINDTSEIQPLLDDFKQSSNRRPNMTFGYMSPLERLSEFVRCRANITDFGRVLITEEIPVNVVEV